MNFNKALGVMTLALSSVSAPLSAHEDLDLAVESVTLDKNCHALITIKNEGRELPESFYQAVRPAFVVIEKGKQREEFKSLRTLDKKRALAQPGGSLLIMSRTRFAENPKPVQVQMLLEGEFLDYGAANDQRKESMDCLPGKGRIAGEAIPDTQPDITVTKARIDPQTCELHVQFSNLSAVGLDATAWDEENGAFLMLMALPAHERQPDIPLVRLDAERLFTRKESHLEYRMPVPRTGAEKWRVGLWRVLNERDFPNNQVEIPVPDACRTAAL